MTLRMKVGPDPERPGPGRPRVEGLPRPRSGAAYVVAYPAIGWVNIVVAVLVVVFNLFGLPYKGMYDNFLIIVSFVFNALTVWYAWTWVSTAA